MSGRPILEALATLNEAGLHDPLRDRRHQPGAVADGPAPVAAPGTMVGANGIVTLVVSRLPAPEGPGPDGEAPTTTVTPP